ncbi:hypothetical protein DLM86_23715 [Paenibacillus flagellatus]|uniref:Uncharacterized protein n=1 Tax=Paenibacillus flagellatus TaxID=2211139 RepID=A0A2V5JYF1_9BACL|nr:hypothetical protein DLM86_23715 [Paenibacillus flagellatus]
MPSVTRYSKYRRDVDRLMPSAALVCSAVNGPSEEATYPVTFSSVKLSIPWDRAGRGIARRRGSARR